MRVTFFGLVHPGVCGVHDHGSLLAKELRRGGVDVQEVWLPTDGRRLGASMHAAALALKAAFRVPRRSTVVWHYSVYAYCFRGLPLPGIFVGAILRLRGIPVVTILHEMALQWEATGKKKLHAVLQRAALVIILAGTTDAIVTTEKRASWLRQRYRVKNVHMFPVFSNFPVDSSQGVDTFHFIDSRTTGSESRLAVPGWASSPGLETVLLGALQQPELSSRDVRIVLLGAPGPTSAAARRWQESASAAGLLGRLDFTDVLTPEDFVNRLKSCHLTVLLFGDGPSTRHTMLATALGNSCAVVATDGPATWGALSAENAIELVQPLPAELARSIACLLDDPGRRSALGSRSRNLYDRCISLERSAERMGRLIGLTAPSNTS